MPEIASTWMRGGTSKCWVFDRADLAAVGRPLDDVLPRLFGSPDPRQVDGVGGGTSTTSKAVILSPADDGDADVSYTFAQVGTDQAVVDWGSNCGNCSSVAGLYAVRRGWVEPRDGTTTVRVRNTNTGQLIVLEVPTPGGVPDERGTAWIPGVPFPGVPVRMWFVDPAGRTTGKLFPTGAHIDEVPDGGGTLPVTIVDAGAPLVVVAARSVGLAGDESPAEIDAWPGLADRLDALRRHAAVAIGLADSPGSAERAVPKLALVAEPHDDRSDLAVRMLSMGRAHPALAITGSVGLTLAARTPGTVIDRLAGTASGAELRLATPAGTVTTRTGEHEGRLAVAVTRTTRRLAEATLVLPEAESPQETLVTSGEPRHDDHSAPEEVAVR
ncbi:PrpF domain-containing protein [Nocardiopsis sediminis]|uniref:PrpF domain-containing protein n=1 Tax=Nocardiopsis sediminis TaxID=1778267 RepID=A0ABV8FKL6_9ACTN